MAVILSRSIGGVFVDVVVSEQVTAAMEVPTHPVEKGAKISDHAWRSPTVLRMSCAAGDPVATYQALFSVMATAEPFNIVTGFGLFRSMLLTRIEPKRDVETGAILDFEAELIEAIIVSTATSGGSATANGGNGDERAAGTTNRGEVQARDVPSPGQQLLTDLEAL